MNSATERHLQTFPSRENMELKRNYDYPRCMVSEQNYTNWAGAGMPTPCSLASGCWSELGWFKSTKSLHVPTGGPPIRQMAETAENSLPINPPHFIRTMLPANRQMLWKRGSMLALTAGKKTGTGTWTPWRWESSGSKKKLSLFEERGQRTLSKSWHRTETSCVGSVCNTQTNTYLSVTQPPHPTDSLPNKQSICKRWILLLDWHLDKIGSCQLECLRDRGNQ